MVQNLDHPILEVEDGYPVRPFPITASLLPHLGANTILLVPRSIKLTKTMGFPGQNQWKEHDRTCIAYARESIKYAICPAGNNPSQMRVEIHYRRLFGDSISGEVQSLLRVLEKPTVTALSHLFAGLKLPTMEKNTQKLNFDPLPLRILKWMES